MKVLVGGRWVVMLLEDQPGPDQPPCQALSVSLWQHPFSLSLGAAPHCFKAAKKEGWWVF